MGGGGGGGGGGQEVSLQNTQLPSKRRERKERDGEEMGNV